MFSKQEQFEKDAIESIYGFVDPDYTLYDTYGRHAKPDVLSMASLSRQVCGKNDAKYSAILSLIEKYVACDPADAHTLNAEEDLLKAIIKGLDEYVEEAQTRLDAMHEK